MSLPEVDCWFQRSPTHTRWGYVLQRVLFVSLNFYIGRCSRDSTSTALSGNRADTGQGFHVTREAFAFTKLQYKHFLKHLDGLWRPIFQKCSAQTRLLLFSLEFYPTSGLKIPLRLTINNETASVSSVLYIRWTCTHTSPTRTGDHQFWMFQSLNVPSIYTFDYKYQILQSFSSNPYWFQQIRVPARKELHDHRSC